METASISKADRFLPLVAFSPESSGGSVSLQNILDLKNSGLLDALRVIQREIVRMRSQSQIFNDGLAQDPLLNAFFRFVDATHEVVQARRIMDSGQYVTVVRQDGTHISLDPENFYTTPLKECLVHVQERYGRFDWKNHSSAYEGLMGGAERIIARTKWLLMKNHAVDYLMTFKVSRVKNSGDFMIRIAKEDEPETASEKERKERLAEAKEFLVECCHPGRLGVFPAAIVQNRKNGVLISPPHPKSIDGTAGRIPHYYTWLTRVSETQSGVRFKKGMKTKMGEPLVA